MLFMGYDQKILWSVVKSIFVDVVNVLAGKQRSADGTLHYKTMLCDPAVTVPNDTVTLIVDVPHSLVDSILGGNQPTRPTTQSRVIIDWATTVNAKTRILLLHSDRLLNRLIGVSRPRMFAHRWGTCMCQLYQIERI